MPKLEIVPFTCRSGRAMLKVQVVVGTEQWPCFVTASPERADVAKSLLEMMLGNPDHAIWKLKPERKAAGVE